MIKKLIVAASLILTTFLFALFGYMAIILFGNYAIDEQKLVLNQASTIVDESGQPISKIFLENREMVTINQIPEHVQEAFVAVEDVRFYEHNGFDLRAIARALYRDIQSGSRAEGGSTITQQLAKNLFLTNDKTFLRKTKEVLIAMNLERRYSKDELLGLYVNTIYFGHGKYGIQAAAQHFFNKNVEALNLEEGALLAAIPKAPNQYSPFVDQEKSEQRRNLVLSLMSKSGYITPEEATRLQGKMITLYAEEEREDEAFYTYLDMVLEEASEKYHLSQEEILTGGYKIVTPIEKNLQQHSFQLLQDDSYFPLGNEDAEAAFVLIDNETGGVLAVHGGRQYVRLGLNRVHVPRQPGSVLKPLAVFAPALEKANIDPYTLLNDELQVFHDDYQPRNANGIYSGQITMYDALKNSTNVPAVWLLNEIGIQHSAQYLTKFGLEIDDRHLGVALGGLEKGVSPLDLTAAYRSFASNGKRVEPFFIKEIYDQHGQLIAEHKENETKVLSEQTAWNMTRMLESVVTDGTGKAGISHYSLAGKTGTTSFEKVENATRDAWFVGYNQQIVGSLWMGYDRTTEEQFLKGGSEYPTKLFKDIVNKVPDYYKQFAWDIPNEVEDLQPPVELPLIEDLVAVQSFGGEGLLSIQLKWTPSDDRRVHYHVYELNGQERTLLATVIGMDYFYQPKLNIFSEHQYEVVPVDTVTQKVGTPSNLAVSSFRFGLH
ncbi:penicillin-binding protein 1F [Bacillus sp. TS-2]|nr:penicillin-binding protein 1F [Bacillus sp. TS-2]